MAHTDGSLDAKPDRDLGRRAACSHVSRPGLQVEGFGHGGFGGFGHGGFGHSRPLAAQSFAALSTRSVRLNGVVP